MIVIQNQWIDIDLDYLNGFSDKVERFSVLKQILSKIPKTTPCKMFIEHHHVLPFLRENIKKGFLKTPFYIFRIDHHHDYYNKPPGNGVRIDCANFGYNVPIAMYKEFHWVTTRTDSDYPYWKHAKKWIQDMGREAHRTSKFKWNPKQVGLCTVTVSPDYQELGSQIFDFVSYIADYFNLKYIPYCSHKKRINKVYNWEIIKI